MSLTLEMLGPSPDVAKLGAGEHNDGGGLHLIVRESCAAHWKFKFTLFGKATKMGLGSMTERSVEEARELAHRFRRLVRDGKDPRNERAALGAPGNGTTTPLFLPFARERLANLTFKNPKSMKCWTRTIEVHFEPLHKKQMHEIALDDVIAVLKPLYENIPAVGREARQRLELILNAAIKRHDKAMGPNYATLAMLKGELPKLPKKGTVRGSHPALHHSLMPGFWVDLRKIDTISSKALQLLILTGVRTNELLQMRFDQVKAALVEKDAMSWRIPGRVMKAAKRGEKGIDADIPLTPIALAIIEEMRTLVAERECLVFPSLEQPGKYGVQLGERTLLALIQERMRYNGAYKPKVSTHGMRATFKTWTQEELPDDVDQTAEFCLHHVKGDAAKLAYMRGSMWKKRLALLTEWEGYVTGSEKSQAADAKLAA
jgi:integrase